MTTPAGETRPTFFQNLQTFPLYKSRPLPPNNPPPGQTKRLRASCSGLDSQRVTPSLSSSGEEYVGLGNHDARTRENPGRKPERAETMATQSKKAGMTRDELAAFSARANRLFRGETDRELWSLALPRIAEMESSVALAALENYAIQWGGPRARFIPAKFFEFLADVQTRRSELAQREARVRESDRRRIGSSRDAMVCEADWASLRREIETANPLAVGEAIDALRSIGWGNPPAAFADWPRRWIVAVADIVARRTCRAYNPETWNFDREVPALEFYRMAGRPPESPAGTF